MSDPGALTKSAEYRRVFGYLPAGVVVVAARSENGELAGMACSSFGSVSLEPALAGVYVGAGSTTWPRIRAVGSCCVSVLAGDQAEVARMFSRSNVNRFASIRWHLRSGQPAIDDAAAWFDCRVRSEISAGDHVLVLTDVLGLETSRRDESLVSYRGGFSLVSPNG